MDKYYLIPLEEKLSIYYQYQDKILISYLSEYYLLDCDSDLTKNSKKIGWDKITHHDFHTIEYGKNYENINKYTKYDLGNYYSCKSPNGNLFLTYYEENLLYIFNSECQFIDKFSLDYGSGIYSMACNNDDYVWFAHPAYNTVSEFSLKEKKESFLIGEYNCDHRDDSGDILDYPEHLSISNNKLYISSMGNNTLFSLDLLNKKLATELTFDSSIWSYDKVNNREFVYLDKLYELIRY